jgi:GNAT superfamily N-acetyltransferase
MEIIDLTEEYEGAYFVCLEDWSDEIKEGGDHKRVWFSEMKGRGLGVKIALDGKKACGMIHYIPIEQSFAEGKDLYYIYCIWVHGHKKGIGNYQKRGIGKALLRAAEEDARLKGAKGMVAWGITLPFFMRAGWFKKQGYKKADKMGIQVLLWKPFTEDAVAPKWIREKRIPGKGKDRVSVVALLSGWCPAQNMVFERAKRAASEFGEKVEFQEIRTIQREAYLEWGISDALFIDGKKIRTGPPPSYQKIRKKIAKKAR